MAGRSVGPLLAALADDTRRAVLDAVAAHGPTTATRLTDGLPVTRQAIAKHLSILHDAGLVASDRRGRETFFEVVPGSLRPVGDWVATTEAAWGGRLARLRDRVEAR